MPDDDWDDDPRPIRRRRKPAGPSPAVLVGAGAVALVGVLAAGVVVYAVSTLTTVTPPTGPAVAKTLTPPRPIVTTRPINVSPQPMTPIPPAAVKSSPATLPTASPPPPAPKKGWPVRWTDRPPADVMVGEWVADLGATLSTERERWGPTRVRFEADGRFQATLPTGQFAGRWAVARVSGRVVAFRFTADDRAKQPRADVEWSVSFLSDDHLELLVYVPRDPFGPDKVRGYLRRSDAASVAGPNEK